MMKHEMCQLYVNDDANFVHEAMRKSFLGNGLVYP